MPNDGQSAASAPRDGARVIEAANDVRNYGTSERLSWESSNSDGYLARVGTGGVDGKPIDSRMVRVGSGSVIIEIVRRLPPKDEFRAQREDVLHVYEAAHQHAPSAYRPKCGSASQSATASGPGRPRCGCMARAGRACARWTWGSQLAGGQLGCPDPSLLFSTEPPGRPVAPTQPRRRPTGPPRSVLAV
jgi:hypothetical protein